MGRQQEEQKKLDWLRKRPYTLLFLDGSHENYDLLAQYPTEELFGGKVQAWAAMYHVCRGSVLELEKKNTSVSAVRKARMRRSGTRRELVDAGDALGRGIRLLRAENLAACDTKWIMC